MIGVDQININGMFLLSLRQRRCAQSSVRKLRDPSGPRWGAPRMLRSSSLVNADRKSSPAEVRPEWPARLRLFRFSRADRLAMPASVSSSSRLWFVERTSSFVRPAVTHADLSLVRLLFLSSDEAARNVTQFQDGGGPNAKGQPSWSCCLVELAPRGALQICGQAHL